MFYSKFFKQTFIHHFITDLLIVTYFWASVTDIKQITKGIEGQFYDKKYDNNYYNMYLIIFSCLWIEFSKAIF